MPERTATPATLHLFLGIGLVVLAAAFLTMNLLGVAPTLKADADTARTIAYVLAGVPMAMVAVAQLVLRPRVPPLGAAQSTEQYWATQENVQPIMLVWFVSEGAGVLAATGYLITGSPIALAAMLVAIAAFWLSGPTALVKIQ
jgi:hypothetical protein